jgi:hypothetical protein
MTSYSGLQLRSRLQQRLLRSILHQISLLVCDVDGVLTDGGLHYDAMGGVVQRFDVHDGLAVRMLQRAGIIVAQRRQRWRHRAAGPTCRHNSFQGWGGRQACRPGGAAAGAGHRPSTNRLHRQ